MNRTHPARGRLPCALRHAAATPPPDSLSAPQRRHRALVRLGRALLVIGPLLFVGHLVIDAQFAGRDASPWMYTVASLEAAIIMTIVGIALACRRPPADAPS